MLAVFEESEETDVAGMEDGRGLWEAIEEQGSQSSEASFLC